jgi:hypothetical protein
VQAPSRIYLIPTSPLEIVGEVHPDHQSKLFMNTCLKLVSVPDLPHYLEKCRAFLPRGLAAGQVEMDSAHIQELLERERAWLIAGEDLQGNVFGCLVVQFIPLAHYTVAHVLTVGGLGIVNCDEHWESVKAWMRQKGAHKIQGVCNRAQARLWRQMGFRSAYEVIRQDL